MTKPKLKIGPIANTTPVKLPISVSPDLQRDLGDYALIYQRTYGSEVKIADLIPLMLEAFLAGDIAFKRARKSLQ
ncbi:MAG: DUF2274 domain-containing protein [Pseudomonadota bacterium]